MLIRYTEKCGINADTTYIKVSATDAARLDRWINTALDTAKLFISTASTDPAVLEFRNELQRPNTKYLVQNRGQRRGRANTAVSFLQGIVDNFDRGGQYNYSTRQLPGIEAVSQLFSEYLSGFEEIKFVDSNKSASNTAAPSFVPTTYAQLFEV